MKSHLPASKIAEAVKSAKEAGLLGKDELKFPTTKKGIISRANAEEWPVKVTVGIGGTCREYEVACIPGLPKAVRTRLGLDAVVAAAGAATDDRLMTRAEALAAFKRLPPWQRKGANAKLAIIRACHLFLVRSGLGRTEGQDSFCLEYNMGRIQLHALVHTEIHQVHPSTLRQWIKEETEHGIMGLVDGGGNRKDKSKIESYITGTDAAGNPIKPYVDAILAIMTREPHVEPKKAMEFMRGCAPDGPEISTKSVKRWMQAWQEIHQEEWAMICNPDVCKGTRKVSFGRADALVTGPNQRWEIDVTPADLLLTDGRWKIIGMVDVGWRGLKLQVKRTEKSADNLDLVRRGLLDWGVPCGGELRTDNGSAYLSHWFLAVINDLEIHQHICTAFGSEEKPFIERAFGTLSHDLVEHLVGYCGHNVAERKAIEARKSFAQRLMEKGELIEMAMTGEQLQAFLDRWLAIYHETPHSGLGDLTPNLVLSRWPHPIHRIQDERALDVLLAPVAGNNGIRVIGKKGLQIDNFEYIHHAFGLHIGKSAFCRQTDDMGKIIVEIDNEIGGRDFLCVAECPEITGIDRAEVSKHGQALQKQLHAGARELTKKYKRQYGGKTTAEVIMDYRESKIAERTGNVAYMPKREIAYTTPALEAASTARSALDGYIPPAVQEIRPEVQAMKEQIKAELAQDKTRGVASLQVESGKAIYKRMKGLRQILTDGGTLPIEEYQALTSYEMSNEFRARRDMEEELTKAVK